MMSNGERLVYMANQIARNFETMGLDKAAAATADHIKSFWDPRMRAQIDALAEEGTLGDVARSAVEMLRHGAVAHQTRATTTGSAGQGGGSDAG